MQPKHVQFNQSITNDLSSPYTWSIITEAIRGHTHQKKRANTWFVLHRPRQLSRNKPRAYPPGGRRQNRAEQARERAALYRRSKPTTRWFQRWSPLPSSRGTLLWCLQLHRWLVSLIKYSSIPLLPKKPAGQKKRNCQNFPCSASDNIVSCSHQSARCNAFSPGVAKFTFIHLLRICQTAFVKGQSTNRWWQSTAFFFEIPPLTTYFFERNSYYNFTSTLNVICNSFKFCST